MMTAATPADPTLAALAKFDDLEQWERRQSVPVFDAHEGFDQAKLYQIAENCNRREKSTGDACPITLGHTISGAPEKYQPDIVGYARNFRVGTFGPQQKVAILADFYFKKDRYAEAMEYPRRSVELWPGELYFDPISIIKRTPVRDLGLLTFGKDPGRQVLRYAMADEDQDLVSQLLGSAPGPMDAVKQFMCDYMKSDPLMKFLASRYGKEAGLSDPERYSPAYPGGGNTYLPGGVKMSEETKALQTSVEKFQKDLETQAAAYAKLQGEHEKLLTRVGEAEKARQDWEAKYYAKERESALKELAKEFQLDVAAEAEYAADMTADKFAKHVERIKKHYKPVDKKPLADFFVGGQVPEQFADGGKTASQLYYKELSAEDAAKVRKYALDKGKTYSEARAELFAAK